MTPASHPVSFRTAAAFRAWLERHHATARELDVRLWRTHALDRGMGYAAALDEALCFGWIDGVRRAVDADSFRIRFTPRKRGSRWSLVNVRHAERLVAAGRMHAAGLAAFRARDPDDPRRYAFEAQPVALSPAFARKLRANAAARKYFASTPPWYRRVVTWWVMSARRAETRERRLAHLIERSERGIAIRELHRAKTKTAKSSTVKSKTPNSSTAQSNTAKSKSPGASRRARQPVTAKRRST